MELETKVRAASKEIGQVSVAVSVVGTRRTKLLQLAKLAQDVMDTLHGERPEVKKAILALRQRIHDVRTSRHDQSAASRLVALKKTLDDVLRLVEDGIGVADEVFKVGDIAVGNEWGYTEIEAARALDAIREVGRKMKGLGISTEKLTIVLDPTWAGDGQWAVYDKQWETIAMVPSGPGSARGLANEVGMSLWDSEFEERDREAWASQTAFAQAFGGYLTGHEIPDDHWARLRVTIGRSSTKWPKRV